ncbi:MAG: TlpA family protein disulfide reductase [Verrucomicrobiaceae bacterium]|nr:TlpA family protein disulfide reductase [Verrucomicrobiaceae bacterium]
MKSTASRSLVVALCLAAGISLAETKSAAPAADALWQKVEEVMNGMKNPKERPKSREEAMAMFKKGLEDFDAAVAKLEAKNPKDVRLWKARLFAATTAGVREKVGLPAKGELMKGLKEIVASAEADKDTKGEASAILVLESEREIEEGTLKGADWTKQAEAHLKAYPDSRLNQAIQRQMDTQKQMADLKAKPVDLKFTAVDGREIDLAKLRGKVVLIDFWATWCGPCVGEIPNVVAAYEKLHGKGFEIVGISLDQDKEKLESFVKEKGMKWAQYFDGKGWQNEISSRFGIQSIPAMWLVNKKGMLVSNDVRGRLEEMVEKALKE